MNENKCPGRDAGAYLRRICKTPEDRYLDTATSQDHASRHESADNYAHVIARLNARWRIIRCRDGIQWIIQKSETSGRGTEWRGRSYCRTKKALIRSLSHLVVEFEPKALTFIEALPGWIEG